MQKEKKEKVREKEKNIFFKKKTFLNVLRNRQPYGNLVWTAFPSKYAT